ncbi:MAG: tetratricopeptide repeat protein [Planctomycetes bacterium]|nr:tetratricopeptide repeat protein [Planctomycetota bacterium]
MSEPTAGELFESGQLDEAIQAALAVVKKAPTDTVARGLLAQLLCFAGDLERADTHLNAISTQKPEGILGVALVRQLIRAEQARQQFYAEGRLPEFLEEPPEHVRLHLQASICIRDGALAEAAELLAQAEEKRPKVSGVCDGEAFDDLRDLDDLTACFLETLTTTGKYYWIPFERVSVLEFHKPERPLDLLWRRCHMIVENGPDGEVFLPALYAGSHSQTDNALRLGRATEWYGEENQPVRGLGQRMLLFGDSDRPILELSRIEVNQPHVPG